MAIWSTGSISDHITNLVGTANVPSSISGTTMLDMIEQQINFANTFIGVTIGTTAIDEKYQPAIIDLSLSKLIYMTDAQEGGVDEVQLGELTISQGRKDGNIKTADRLKMSAEMALKHLGRDIRFKRVIAC